MTQRRSLAGPPAWQTVAREQLQDCRVFDVYHKSARSPHTGATHSFFRIEADDWVNVVALTTGDELVMVRQYRHGSDEITLEIWHNRSPVEKVLGRVCWILERQQ